jgi:hypothetical protein
MKRRIRILLVSSGAHDTLYAVAHDETIWAKVIGCRDDGSDSDWWEIESLPDSPNDMRDPPPRPTSQETTLRDSASYR